MRRFNFPILEFFTFSVLALCVFLLFQPPATDSGSEAAEPEATTPGGATFTRSSVEAKEHTLFELRPAFDLPEGHEVFGVHWRIGTLDVRLYEGETVAVGTGPPGDYVVEFFASHARVKTDADGDRVMLFPPSSVSETWSVHVQGQRPPPKDPDKPEPPKPGVSSAAIIYDGLQTPPIAGEGATNELRKAGKPVFFVSAGVKTGSGNTPAFLANAIEAAKRNGLPALVLMTGETITSVSDLPATKAAIIEAAK